MASKPDFNTDNDLAEIIQRVSEARPYRLKKADYLEIAKSLTIGSIEVVKGAVCVAAVAAVSVNLTKSEEEIQKENEDGYRDGIAGYGFYWGGIKDDEDD